MITIHRKKNSPLLSHLHLHFFLFQSVFQLKHECQVVKKHLHKRVWKKIFIYIKKPCISCVNDRILFFRQINHSLLLYKYAHTWRETTVVYSWLQEVNTWYPVGFQFCVFFYMSSSAMKKKYRKLTRFKINFIPAELLFKYNFND